MIYTSRYEHNMLGAPVSISLYPPKNFKGEHLKLLAPEYKTLQTYKKSGDWEQYKAEYRLTIKQRFKQIQEWLFALNQEVDITLLCYEDSEQCHRHLVQMLIDKWRPEIWGTRLDQIAINQFKTLNSPTIKHQKEKVITVTLETSNNFTDLFKIGDKLTSTTRHYRFKQIATVLDTIVGCARLKWENGDTTITNTNILRLCDKQN